MQTPYALELERIYKAFGQIQANADVTLRVRRGTVHGIVGENGAGKTTLMRVAYGFHQPDAGRVVVDGTPVELHSPRNALGVGIGMVHQHSLLVESMTVVENVLLATAEQVLGFAPARDRIRALAEKYDLAVNPEARVADLSVAARQRVEIIKALFFDAQILILDEPTAVLTPQEARTLFGHLKNFTIEGKTVVLITHKLPEVIAVTSRVSVMRGGQVVMESDTTDTTEEALAEAMVGRSVALRLVRGDDKAGEPVPGAPVLSISDLEVEDDHGAPRVRGISLDVHAGEIVGIAAVEGNGQSELVEAMTGLRRPTAGTVTVGGRDVTDADPRTLRSYGVRHIPEDRLFRGVNRTASVADNLILGRHNRPPLARRGLLNAARVRRVATEAISNFRIAASNPYVTVGTLSGGNMQKVVIARELDGEPEVVVAAQPTQGVDVGASEFIRQQMLRLRDKGAAVLLVSSELTEIMDLSDRVYVLFNGSVAGVLNREDVSEERLGLLMMGVTNRTTDQAGAVTSDA